MFDGSCQPDWAYFGVLWFLPFQACEALLVDRTGMIFLGSFYLFFFEQNLWNEWHSKLYHLAPLGLVI